MKVAKIDSLEKAEAFMYFLAKERFRHLKDVEKIDAEINRLSKKWGIDPPTITEDVWFEA